MLLKLASSVIEFVPAHIVFEIKPELKLADGAGPACTVIVTTLEIWIPAGASHKSPAKLARAFLLYAVVTGGLEGSKSGESDDNIPTKPRPSPMSISHSYTIVPPSAAKVENGLEVPVIAGGSSPLQIGDGPT